MTSGQEHFSLESSQKQNSTPKGSPINTPTDQFLGTPKGASRFLSKPVSWILILSLIVVVFVYKITTFTPLRNAKIPSLRIETNYPLRIENHPEVTEKYPDTYRFLPNEAVYQAQRKSFLKKFANDGFRPAEHHDVVILGSGPEAMMLLGLLKNTKNTLLLDREKQLGGTVRGEKAGDFTYSYLHWQVTNAELSAFLQLQKDTGVNALSSKEIDFLKNEGSASLFNAYFMKLAARIPAGNIRSQANVHQIFLTKKDDRPVLGIVYEDQRGKPVHLTTRHLVSTLPSSALIEVTNLPELQPRTKAEIVGNSSFLFHFVVALESNSEPFAPLVLGSIESKIFGNIELQIKRVSPTHLLLQGKTAVISLDPHEARQKVNQFLTELRLTDSSFREFIYGKAIFGKGVQNKSQINHSQEVGLLIKPLFVRMGIQSGNFLRRIEKHQKSAAQPIAIYDSNGVQMWNASPELRQDQSWVGAFEMAKQLSAQLEN